ACRLGEPWFDRRIVSMLPVRVRRWGSEVPLEGDAPLPGDDLTDHEGVPAGVVHDLDRTVRLVRGNDREHAEAEVEHVLHLVVGDGSGALHLLEDAGLGPAPAPHTRVGVA